MKAAYTGWTWLTAKDAETAKKQLEQSFKECKFLGYDLFRKLNGHSLPAV